MTSWGEARTGSKPRFFTPKVHLAWWESVRETFQRGSGRPWRSPGLPYPELTPPYSSCWGYSLINTLEFQTDSHQARWPLGVKPGWSFIPKGHLAWWESVRETFQRGSGRPWRSPGLPYPEPTPSYSSWWGYTLINNLKLLWRGLGERWRGGS